LRHIQDLPAMARDLEKEDIGFLLSRYFSLSLPLIDDLNLTASISLFDTVQQTKQAHSKETAYHRQSPFYSHYTDGYNIAD
jgi:hypothetical protein